MDVKFGVYTAFYPFDAVLRTALLAEKLNFDSV